MSNKLPKLTLNPVQAILHIPVYGEGKPQPATLEYRRNGEPIGNDIAERFARDEGVIFLPGKGAVDALQLVKSSVDAWNLCITGKLTGTLIHRDNGGAQ